MKIPAMWEKPAPIDEALIKRLRFHLGDATDVYVECARLALQNYASSKAYRELSGSQRDQNEQLLLVSTFAKKLKKALKRLSPDAASLFMSKFNGDPMYTNTRKEELVYDFDGSTEAKDLKNKLQGYDPNLASAVIVLIMGVRLKQRLKSGITVLDLPPLMDLIAKSATPAKVPLKAGVKTDGRVVLVRDLATCFSKATNRRATATIGGPFERAVAPILKAAGIHTTSLKPLIRKALRG